MLTTPYAGNSMSLGYLEKSGVELAGLRGLDTAVRSTKKMLSKQFSRFAQWIGAAFLLGIITPAHALFISNPQSWQNHAGTFVRTPGAIYASPSQGISATYSPSTEILTLLGTNVRYGEFAAPHSVAFEGVFSVTALIAEFSGEFLGGTYSMIAGAQGVPEWGMQPGTLLLQGSILEMNSRYSPSPYSAGWYNSEGDLAALMSVSFKAPELQLVNADYLHLATQVTMRPYEGTTPWASEFSDRGSMSWQIDNVVRVPEPGSLLLVVLFVVPLLLAQGKRCANVRP